MTADPTGAETGLRMAIQGRTLLAGCHQALVRPIPGGAREIYVAGLVDVRGIPHLLLPGCTGLQAGPVRLTCGAEDLGRLHLNGSLREQFPPQDDPDLVRAMREHLTCLPAGGWAPCDCRSVVAMRFAVCAAWIDVARSGVVESVDVEDLLQAEPDLWVLHRTDAMDHLNDQHSEDIRDLAATFGRRRADTVVVTRLDSDGMTLACVDQHGVAELRIPFRPRMPDPRHLESWLAVQGQDGQSSDVH